MIIECSSCNKKFVIPDTAIGKSGRVVQCSACGNKWHQESANINTDPIEKSEPIEKSKPIKISKDVSKAKNKNVKRKPKRKVSLYTKEYLQQKHGIKVINPSIQNLAKNTVAKKTKLNSMGFYSKLFVLLIFLITFYGILNLSKEIIVYNFPYLESYINYIFETVNIIQTIVQDIYKSY